MYMYMYMYITRSNNINTCKLLPILRFRNRQTLHVKLKCIHEKQ